MTKPDFIIVGPIKTATTSLFKAFVQHPKLLSPENKELHFFSNEENFKKGLDWYFSLFPEKESEDQKIFETTPNYFHSPRALHLIKNRLGSTKIICILRNPVGRFVSQYKHFRAINYAFTTDEGKAKAERFPWYEEMSKRDWKGEERLFKDVVDNVKESKLYYSGGEYAVRLKMIESLFFKKQVKVVIYEDLISDPQKICSEIFEFVGVENFKVEFGKDNSSDFWSEIYDASKEIDVNSIIKLQEYYKPHNQILYQMLEKNLEWD